MLFAILLAIGLNLGSNSAEPKTPSGVTVSFADGLNQRIMPTRLFAARVEAEVASSRHRAWVGRASFPAPSTCPSGPVPSWLFGAPDQRCCPSTVKWSGRRWAPTCKPTTSPEQRRTIGHLGMDTTREGRPGSGCCGMAGTSRWNPSHPTTHGNKPHDNIEHGLDLIAEHRCTACHASQPHVVSDQTGRRFPPRCGPTIARTLGARVAAGSFSPPGRHRHAALLSGPNAEQDAADLAAWVVSMGSGTLQAPRTARRRQSLGSKIAIPELSRSRT